MSKAPNAISIIVYWMRSVHVTILIPSYYLLLKYRHMSKNNQISYITSKTNVDIVVSKCDLVFHRILSKYQMLIKYVSICVVVIS